MGGTAVRGILPLSVPADDAAALLRDQVAAFVAACSELTDLELLAPARCHGWSRVDTVVHVRLGLEELLAAWVARTAEPATRDAASYWSGHPDGRDEDPVPHILWLRRTASAYTRPARAVHHLKVVAGSLTAALDHLAAGCVAFQGMVLSVGDLLATWVVELAVHQLDLDVEAPPTPGALALTRRTLEAVAGGPLPAGLDDSQAVLVALGRVPWPVGVEPVTHLPVSL